ncbi:hypothetical protein V6N13_139440 [Hibiscus sabdariffa]
MQLESGTTKICKQHDVDPIGIPRLSNQPTTLEAIPILDNKGVAKSSLPLKPSPLIEGLDSQKVDLQASLYIMPTTAEKNLWRASGWLHAKLRRSKPLVAIC